MNPTLVARLTPLSPAERIQITYQLARQYRHHHPQSQHPGPRSPGLPHAFTTALARRTGRSASTIRSDLLLARRLGARGRRLLEAGRLNIPQARSVIVLRHYHERTSLLTQLAAPTARRTNCCPPRRTATHPENAIPQPPIGTMDPRLVARLTPLSVAERIRLTCQLAEEYYSRYPEAHKPGRRSNGTRWGFARTLAALTGRSAVSITADVNLGRRLGPVGLDLLQQNRLTITQARLQIRTKTQNALALLAAAARSTPRSALDA